MSEKLEIEVVTTLRGPLAARLIALSARDGRLPVDVMADLVNDALVKPVGAERDELLAVHRELNALRIKYKNLEQLRERDLQLVPKAPAVAFLPAVQALLLGQAKKRGLDFDDLVHKIVVTVATDDLFAAVLDT